MTSSLLLICRRVFVHWRAIILLLVLALATFLIVQADFFDLLIFALFLIIVASQFFWIGRILDLAESIIPGKPRRARDRRRPRLFVHLHLPLSRH